MTATQLNVSIIIVNYNTTELTKQCINYVKEHTLKNTYEIILIDNASHDQSIHNINQFFPDVRFVASPENVGFGRANNIGINMALGKYVFLLNTDAFLISDAIGEFWDFMEHKSNERIACCGGECVDDKLRPSYSYGNFPSVLEAFSSIGFYVFYKKYFNRYIHSGVINYSQETRSVDFLIGAGLFIRKMVLDKVGGFDPDFFLYFEETELAYRILKAGYKSYIIPSVKIIHLGGESQKVEDAINLKQVGIFSKSRNIYFAKRYNKSVSYLVKILYTIQALLEGLYKWNGKYTSVAKTIFNS